jgi:hypothetical protein
VRGDPADPRRDREGHLDHLVESRFIVRGTEGAAVLLLLDGFERGIGFEHPAAARTEHIPGKLEHAEPCGMQERADHRALVARLPQGGKH